MDINRLKAILKQVYQDCRVEVIFNSINGKSKYVLGPTFQVEVWYKDCLFTSIVVSEDCSRIEVTKIAKCYQDGYEYNKGPLILRKIEMFAQLIGVRHIQLDDGSAFGVSKCPNLIFSLKTLYLLTKGMTWYHSQGYDSTLTDTDKQVMKNQIEVPMYQFIEKLKAILPTNFLDYCTSEHCETEEGNEGEPVIIQHTQLDSLLTRINIGFDQLTTVREYFKFIWEKIKDKSTECETLSDISNLLNYIDQSHLVLSYNAEKRFDYNTSGPLEEQQLQVNDLGPELHLVNDNAEPTTQLQLLNPKTSLQRIIERRKRRKQLSYKKLIEKPLGGKKTQAKKTRRRKTKTHHRKNKIFSKKNKKARSFI